MTRKRLLRGLGIGAGLLILAFVGAVYWLFYNTGPAPDAPYRLDMAAVRAEAVRLPGALPDHIEVDTVSHDEVHRIAMVAGTDWEPIDLIRTSYRVVHAERSVIIDTAYDEALAREVEADRFDRDARAHVLEGLDRADLILVTHEHGDHEGGVLTSPRLAQLLPKLRLTREQVGSPAALPWPTGVPRPHPLDYRTIHAVAPGVVLIKAPGHTPGSQMIYVRQANGREFLFMGDVASMLDNVRLGQQRSRYVTGLVSGGDRPAVAAELRAVKAVSRANPDLILVPGHDAAAIGKLAREGLLRERFRLGEPATPR